MLAPVEAKGIKPRARSDRREGVRQRLMMRVAKLRCSSGEYACILQDVSEMGARLRMLHAHPPDSHMFLEFGDETLYAIERRWIDGDEAGFLFSSKVELGEFLKEPRGAPKRRPVRLRIQHSAQIIAGGERGHAMLVNLSAQGACIEAGRRLPLGTALRIEIAGGLASRYAHVAWRKDYRHGLAFQDALPFQQFAELALALQPYDAEPAAQLPALDAQKIYA
jgi:hypothetical protein